MVAQRLAPVAGFHVRGGEHVLAQGAVGHRVEQIVLLTEVPVDAGDADAEVFAEQGHAQVVDRNLLCEFECAADDVIGIDGPAFAPLPLVCSCLLCHYGHLHQSVLVTRSEAVSPIESTGSSTLTCVYVGRVAVRLRPSTLPG